MEDDFMPIVADQLLKLAPPQEIMVHNFLSIYLDSLVFTIWGSFIFGCYKGLESIYIL